MRKFYAYTNSTLQEVKDYALTLEAQYIKEFKINEPFTIDVIDFDTRKLITTLYLNDGVLQ